MSAAVRCGQQQRLCAYSPAKLLVRLRLRDAVDDRVDNQVRYWICNLTMELFKQLIDAAPHPSLELLDIPFAELVQLRAIQRRVDGPNFPRLIVQRAQLSDLLQD